MKAAAKTTRSKTRSKAPAKSKAKPAPARAGGGRWGWRLAKWAAVATIWGVVAVGGVLGWYAADLPDIDEALAATRRPTLAVVAADGATIATFGDHYGTPVRVASLPPVLVQAVLATEDRRFYDHFGLDVIGLARAVVANVRAGGVVQGGSTITQQAAKNLFLSHERTIKRKAQELLLALWLERRFDKDEILAIYLNRAYFGAGAYGVDAAARRFFGRPATGVGLYQSAMLAGLLKAPSRYNPIADARRADGRARQVLAGMVDAGFLSDADVAHALANRGGRAPVTGRVQGRFFADWVAEQVPDFVAAGGRDLGVRTTLDTRLQAAAERRVAEFLAGPGRALGVGEAALVAMTPDGAVRAMVGGGDYRRSQFNRAVQALRQPGSAFKPVVYLAGLEAGLTPRTRLVDAPVAIDGWRPRNFGGGHAGEVSLAAALARSINTVAVKVYQRAGGARVVDAARRLGITATMTAEPSLALGAAEVSLVELTAAYAAFANGGYGVWPYGIEAIEDARGDGIYVRSGSGPGRVIAAGHAAEITAMLRDAVRTGTGRAAALARPAAGKTGTSQNFRDAWFVGYTADLVCGVWVGNDDGTPMKRVTGGGLPATLWRAFMTDAYGSGPIRGFPAPPPAKPAPPEPSLLDRLRSLFGD